MLSFGSIFETTVGILNWIATPSSSSSSKSQEDNSPAPNFTPSANSFANCRSALEIKQELLKNEAFKKLWDKVNSNLHVDIQIVPTDEVKTAKLRNLKCPNDCEKPLIKIKKEPYNIKQPHSYNLFIKERDRTASHIARSIIFETCNAKYYPDHEAIKKEAVKGKLTEEQFAERREEIEWHALKKAKKIADKIDPEMYKKTSPRQFDDWDYHLKHQKDKGHFDKCRKQYRDLMEDYSDTSSQSQSESEDLFISPPGTPVNDRRFD